jgi:hypothetical protein
MLAGMTAADADAVMGDHLVVERFDEAELFGERRVLLARKRAT